jgi:hypothetical protein
VAQRLGKDPAGEGSIAISTTSQCVAGAVECIVMVLMRAGMGLSLANPRVWTWRCMVCVLRPGGAHYMHIHAYAPQGLAYDCMLRCGLCAC